MTPSNDDLAEVSPLRVLTNMLRRRWLIAKVTLATVVLAMGLWILVAPPRQFEAQSVFQPQNAQSETQQTTGLARQLQDLLGVGSGTSMDFYAQVLSSRALLQQAAEANYLVSGPDSTPLFRGTLVDLYGKEGESRESRLKGTVDQLTQDVSVSVDTRSGLMRLATRAPWPELAVALNDTLLGMLHAFDVQRRQAQMGAERAFIEGRMADVRRELDDREARLEAFLQQNRKYQDSPTLTFEVERLQDAVQLRRQLYRSLAESREQARIAEVRNTPVITMIDPAQNNVRTVGGVTAISVVGLAALFLGLVLGLFVAFLSEYFRRQRVEDPVEYGEFARVLGTFAGELSPRRVLGPRRGSAD